MATILSVGDIAIVHVDSVTDAFSFVFLRDVEAGTTINFTDNGWLAAGGFRSGEDTITYTAATAIAAGTVVTLGGLLLAQAGDQIIAYQGDAATPTILHLVDFADGNISVAGDATDAQTTALPPGFVLGINAVAIPFDSSVYAGPTSGSPTELFALSNSAASWIEGGVPPALFSAQTRPTIDLDADDSTHGGRDYGASVVSGGAAVKIADTDIDITDKDGAEITAAEIKVKSAAPGDLLAVNGGLPAGIAVTAYDPATGILRLTGTGSHADYEAAIALVEFSTAGPVGDVKQIEVIAFDGQEWSAEAKAFLEISGSFFPPVLDLDADDSDGGGADYTATYTVGGPAIPIADVDASITDADSTLLESATITILNWNQPSGDTLSISGSLPAGITASAYDTVNLTITLSGPATLADYQTALRQVVYSSTNPSPGTGDRGIQVTVNDGTLTSNIATTYMHIAPANVAPVLNLDADSSTTGGADYLTTFTGVSPVAIADADVLVTDGDDANLVSATIRLTNPSAGDVLEFNGLPPSDIVASTYDSGTGILTLTGTVPLADYQTALKQITFNNTGTPATETRIIEVTVNDEALASNVAHAIIEIDPANIAPPEVDLDDDDSTAPGTSYRTTFTENGSPVAIADTDASIVDSDSVELASVTITLTDPQAGDLLAVLGLLPAGISASAYDPVTGVLTLSGSASATDYQSALRAIRFSTGGDDPVEGLRVIEIVVSDGENLSQAATALMTVEAVNDAPVLTVAPNASYTENAPPIALSPSVGLTDLDDTELTLAVVRIADGSFAGDSDVLSVDGSTSGTLNGITFNWNPAEHTLVFSGTSSVANYQALLQTVEFQSISDDPTNFNAEPTRTLDWAVSDGSTVTTVTTTLDIVAINDAPQTGIAANASYAENGPPVIISPAATATDVDDINFVAGQVRIVTPLAGDVLTVNGLQSGTFSGVDFSYDPTAGRLLFGHPATLADFQTFMQAVAFSSMSDDPTAGGSLPTRTLSWVVSDGDAFSELQMTIVMIEAVNDPPFAQDGSAIGSEDTPINGTLVATDIDSQGLTYRLGAQAVHGAVVINADGTFAYTPAPDFSGPDSFTFIASDGEADSNTAAVSLTIAAVNDAPHLDLDADDSTVPSTHFQTVFAGVALPISDVDVAITDPDSETVVSATIHLLIPGVGDLLSVNGALPAGISASPYDPTTGILTLSGTASLTDYQTAIHQVQFGTSGGTSLASRMIEVKVSDGALDSNAAVTVIDFSAAPEPPEPPLPTVDPHWMKTEEFTIHPLGWSPIIVADFAGDGMSDLLWRNDTTGSLDEWQIVNGGWTGSVDLGAHPGAGWQPASAGDFNGDGTDDIFWFDPASGNTDIWQLANGAWAASVSPGPHPTGFQVAGNGDFDGDGTSDVLWFSPQTGAVDIWKIVNGQWAGSVNPGPAPAGFSVAGTGDFNHDGSDDIAWFNASSGTVVIWEMQNGNVARSIDLGAHPAGYAVVGCADFNADGTSDILWFNPTTSHVDLWKIEDSHWAGSVDIGPHPPGWQPVGVGDSDGNGVADVWWQLGETSKVEAWLLSIH